jgi:AcrR family transcriptional regulator
MSLRKEKAARLKVQILQHTLKMVGKKSFDDLYVEDLCAKVKISKVTFFKYFPQKEDVLLYFFRIWSLQRCVELADKPKEGIQGIIYIFDKISEEYDNHPGFMLSLVGYLSDLRRPPKPFPVKVEEKRLLFPDVDNITSVEMLSVDQMFEKFALEAIFKKDIVRTTNTRDITNLMMTLFLGSVITAHINQQAPFKMFLRRNLDLLLKGLQ